MTAPTQVIAHRPACRLGRRLAVIIQTCLAMSFSVAVAAGEHKAVIGWSQLHVVSFPIDGMVRELHVRPGDRVKAGDVLVELSTTPDDIMVRRFTAELAATQPAVIDAEREYDHAQSLYEQTVLSDVELEKAKLAYEKAVAERDAARARLDYARWKRGIKTARAPWDAVVVSNQLEHGAMLVAEQRSRSWMVLARAGALSASAVLPAADASGLRTGEAAVIKVAGRSFDGSIIGIEREADSTPGYRVTVGFEVPPDQGLLPGTSAVLELP